MSKKKKLLGTIEEVLEAPTASMIDLCTTALLSIHGHGKVFILNGEFVYAVGDNPIMLVSHVDTVRDHYEGTSGSTKSTRSSYGGADKPILLHKERNVLKNLNGILGADDRAGVFACLELARRCKENGLPLPSVLLTNGEECGGIGVKAFIGTGAFKKHDNDTTKMFVEMDRCNAAEWVNYGSDLPKKAQEYVESFGFRKGHGSYSDVRDLQEDYLIPGVNLSIGYYSQHSSNEVLHLDEMWMTINRVYGMLQEPIPELYPVVKSKYYSSGSYGHWDSEGYCSGEWGKGTNATSKQDNGGKKNVESGKKANADGKSLSFPLDKKSRAGVNELIDFISVGGYCPKCGYEWNECECGHILKELGKYCFDAELQFIMENYLVKDDALYTFILCYLNLSDQERADAGVGGKEVTPSAEGEEEGSDQESDSTTEGDKKD